MVVEGYIIFAGFLLLLEIFVTAYMLWMQHQIATGITKISDALNKLTPPCRSNSKRKIWYNINKEKGERRC